MRCVDCIVEENKSLRAAETKQIAIQRACLCPACLVTETSAVVSLDTDIKNLILIF